MVESKDLLDCADAALLRLETNPDDADAIADVFRSFHTVKGVAGFLRLEQISDLSHAVETLLDYVRKQFCRFEGRVVDLVFASLDMLKALMADLDAVVTSGQPFQPRAGLPALLDNLHTLCAGIAPQSEAKTPPPKAVVPPPEPAAPWQEEAAPGEPAPPADHKAGAIAQSVKIDAFRLDMLIDTIGELVIAESIVAQDKDVRALKSLGLERNMALLNKITRKLQDMGMAMRMTPIEPTFKKMARLVRDLAKSARKPVDFVMQGQDTELDRNMVEKRGDPLIHMVRNAVDHGLEATPEDRVKAGKPAKGRITLRAFHKGGNIRIQIQDDGRGLDRDAILAKGIERGLVSDPERMSDQDIYALIFESGFSTAQKVTEISGRGVGMDVVRRNIESLRGKIEIESVRGAGATFTMVLPLTTAIIDGMIIRVGTESYVLPTLSIVESFRPDPDAVQTVKGRGEMIQFRESVLPLFRISRIFDVEGAAQHPWDGIVIVVEDAGRQVALLVDDLLGQQQTVIKSLGEGLGAIPTLAGASIMADGRPGLILDVAGLVRAALE